MSISLLKEYNLNDTIAAVATYPAKSALGVIKISGKKALEIVSKIFIPKGKKDIKKVATYTLHYGWVIEKRLRSGESKREKVLDEVLVSVMRAPYSYTREDVVEISSHGGILVLNRILELVLKKGARLANPGEFSYRAFINGRIDLVQAQSILDIVEAKTEQGLLTATTHLSGKVSKKIEEIGEKLKNIFSQIEASIQFPEEEIEIPFDEIKRSIRKLKKELEELVKASQEGQLIKEGVKCVICGRANVGKSTLFNRLLQEERVIVTELPGTTRDVIEESINIKGLPLKIADTAGILEPKDLIDKVALEKSLKKIAEADLVLLLLDYSQPLSREDYLLLDKIKDKNVILVINKIDLKKGLDLNEVKKFNKPNIKLSALKGEGFSDLEKIIFKNILGRATFSSSDLVFLAQKQKELLSQAFFNLSQSINYCEQGYSLDFVGLLLKEALDNLAKLTGKVVEEEVLREIFSRFCIGK
ncbi:MAG: tRNA uridine-5-carboxymethylaminomethyl(34) synthesis GTPase MnmE [Candidatus Omnitrophota bacterium]|nr:MAG: tRNA uridine-5-carboxymethylaminomethyl(34) synthesis GTPase MnmE [Candidatus Omnitrophota bacterium]